MAPQAAFTGHFGQRIAQAQQDQVAARRGMDAQTVDFPQQRDQAVAEVGMLWRQLSSAAGGRLNRPDRPAGQDQAVRFWAATDPAH